MLFHACENTYLVVKGGFFFTVNLGDMYERMEVKFRLFLRATLWYSEWTDLFQVLLALPNDERNLSIRWLESHVDTRANSTFMPPSVIEDGSPFHIHTI